MIKTNRYESNQEGPNYQRRRRVAGAITGLIVGSAILHGFNESHNQYGYDSAKNPAPPTFMEKNAGVNPTNIVHNTHDK